MHTGPILQLYLRLNWLYGLAVLICMKAENASAVCTSASTSVNRDQTRTSLGDIQNMPTQSKFAIFQGFLHCWSNAPNLGGGGYVCFLKSVRKGRFRNVWVWGGGG